MPKPIRVVRFSVFCWCISIITIWAIVWAAGIYQAGYRAGRKEGKEIQKIEAVSQKARQDVEWTREIRKQCQLPME